MTGWTELRNAYDRLLLLHEEVKFLDNKSYLHANLVFVMSHSVLNFLTLLANFRPHIPG